MPEAARRGRAYRFFGGGPSARAYRGRGWGGAGGPGRGGGGGVFRWGGAVSFGGGRVGLAD